MAYNGDPRENVLRQFSQRCFCVVKPEPHDRESCKSQCPPHDFQQVGVHIICRLCEKELKVE